MLQAHLNNEKRTLSELKQVYTQALKDCEKRIKELSMRTDMDNIQSIVYQKQYQQAIKGQLEGVLEQLHSNEFATVSDFLARSYQDGFTGAMYDISSQGIPLIIPLDQEQIVKAIQTDTKLSTTLYNRLGEDINKLKTSIRAEVSRGIANGSTWNEVADKIALSFKNTPFNAAYNNAVRIARTEGHRIQIQAADDAQHKAKDNGADIVKQWDASLDGRTRKTHRKLDGQIRELDEPFEMDGKKAMRPADFGDPAEDVNCRCALLQRARWALDESELNVLKSRAEYYGLDKTDSFEEYKKKYLKASESERVRQDVLKINDEDTVEKDGKSSTIELPNTENCHYATKEQYAAEKKSCKKNVAKEDIAQTMNHKKADGSSGGYVATHNYSNINSNLRNDGFTITKLDDDDYKTIESLRRAIQANTLNDDYILTRYVNADYLSSVFGIKGRYNSRDDFETLTNSITQVANPYVVKTEIPRITEELKEWIGKKIEPDKAFVSTSIIPDKNIMKDKAVLFNIKAPKGTHAYLPENRKESECILGENTTFVIENVEYNVIGRKWVFDVVVVE